jgi:hypothetical protein
MGITPNDIAAQRAMLERGEEKRKADWKLAERERLRDTFAAAALTGLLAGPGDKDFSMDYWARHAYGAADAMLRDRERVTEPMTKEKRAEVSSAPVFADKTRIWPVSYEKSDGKRVLYDTNHDAVPEAKATNDGGTPKDADGTGNTHSLTDAEREAIEQAAIRVESLCQLGSQQRAATLRKLLERLA